MSMMERLSQEMQKKGGMNNARKVVIYARMNEGFGLACSSANDKRNRWRGRKNAVDAMR